MLDNLTTRLARIVKQIRGEARLTESNIQEALREVRVALLEADVALPVVKECVDAVRARALGQEVVGHGAELVHLPKAAKLMVRHLPTL